MSPSCRPSLGLAVTLAFVGALESGCATAATLPAIDRGIEGHPPDPALAYGHDVFSGARGSQLFEQWWKPRGASRASILLVHGLKDHGARYEELATELAKDGFSVYAIDLRGHAHSGGERVYVESFADYTDDVAIWVDRVRAREPGLSVFLFGHSMGGAVATLYALDHQDKLAGLVLHAAALHLDVPFFKVGGVKMVAALAPHAGIVQLDLGDFSHDPAVVAAGKRDPLVHQPGGAARTGAALFDATHRIEARQGQLSLPLLVLHGDADVVTDPAGSRSLAAKAASKDRTLHIYPGYAHDLVHEPGKRLVLDHIHTWLAERAPLVAGDGARGSAKPGGMPSK